LPVFARPQDSLDHGHAYGDAEALPERLGRHLDAVCVAALWMVRRGIPPLPHLLDLFEGRRVTADVHRALEQNRAVVCRQHDAATV